MIAAAIVLLICSIGSYQNEGYAITVALVVIVIALCALLLTYLMEDKWKMVGPYVACFLMLWNTIGAFILTFDGPFTVTQNGYFASWALCVFAFLATGVSYREMLEKMKKSSAPLGYLILASTVVATACIFAGLDHGRSIFSLIVAILTIALSGTFIFIDQKGTGQGNELRLPLLVILSCLWVVVVILLTAGNKSMFPVTGNGYFGAWAGLISCVWATFTCS